MALEIFTLRERPDLRPLIFASDLQSVWPEFMTHSAAAELYFSSSMFDRYLDYAFAGVADGSVVGRAFCVPFAFNTEGRAELPDGGWDQVIRWAHDDRMIGRAPNALSALEISLLPEARGSGVPQTKVALFAHGGRISIRTVLGKFFCTSVTIASGTISGSPPTGSPNTPSGCREKTILSAIRNRITPPAIESDVSERRIIVMKAWPPNMNSSNRT